MRGQDAEEERDAVEKSSQSSHRMSTDVEQEQGLLKDWKEADDAEGGRKKLSPPRSRWNWKIYLWVTGSLIVLLVLTVGIGLFSFSGTAKQPLEDALGVQSNDYILPSDWNYDAPSQRREYHWTIRDQIHNPDGIYRAMMLVNNQFPGPLIEVNEGDTIIVHVKNQAVNATSIHWHGIFQKGTPYMDGTIGVTQCPIAPGSEFTYEFKVSGQSGTYWWHAHQGLQASDGVHGPLIIHHRNEKKLQRIPYDTDRVVLIADHYHDLSSALLWQYLKPDMENAEPVPDGGVINGRYAHNCDEFPERKCDNTSAHVGIPRIDLAPNQNHRLRLINVGAFAEFQVQIDEHEVAVTEVDGTDVEPMKYHRVNINPAQRYSVVVHTAVNTADTFWLRARMIYKCFTDPPRNFNPDVLGIINYNKGTLASSSTPRSKDWEEALALKCKDLNTTELTPVQQIAAPAEADVFFYLRANFEIGAYRLSRGFFNASTWRANIKSPSLFRAVDGLSVSNGTFHTTEENTAFVNQDAFDSSNELVIQTNGIQTIDLLVSNFDEGVHPLHLHGYKYFVLAQGHGYPPLTEVGADINRANLAPLYDNLDLSNPLRRDTASVEAFGWILLRLVADNPGAWALHCHISWHTEAGLLMQLLTRADGLVGMKVPDSHLELCTKPGIEKGVGPMDEDYRDLAK